MSLLMSCDYPGCLKTHPHLAFPEEVDWIHSKVAGHHYCPDHAKQQTAASKAENQPTFVLKAQDMLAPEVVREWIYRARTQQVEPAKIEAARLIAQAMEDWQIDNFRKKPD